MENKKLIMAMVAVLALLLLFSFLPFVYAQGEIKRITYSPSEVVALEDVTFSITVENTGSERRDYLMSVQIAKEGNQVSEQHFTFTIDRGKSLTLTPTYVPQSIGEYEVIVKLHDKFEIDTFDTKFISFNSVSHIGPFDIEIEPLTTRIRPGFLIPVKVLLENQGTKALDIEVKISVNCHDRVTSQSLVIFVPGNEETERLVSVQTCEQDGLYEVVGSIILFNRTWISSASQFFVNSTHIRLEFEVPESILLQQGETISFPIEITNRGNQPVTDLKFVIQRIPLAWQTSTPESVDRVEPNGTAIFLINLTIPEDAESRIYEARMTAVSTEVLERHIINLQVVSLSTAPLTIIPMTYILVSLGLVSGISIVAAIVRKLRNREPQQISQQNVQTTQLEVLKKLKERLKSGG